MTYFVDTNTCIYFLNGKYPSVKEKFLSISPKKIKISAIVKSELLLGAFKSQTKKQTTDKVEKFLEPFDIVDFKDDMSYNYTEIRGELEAAGTKIGANDLLIAATVLHEKGILVTHNANEFSRVNGLEIEDWAEE